MDAMVGMMSKEDERAALEQVRRLYELWTSGNLSSEDLIFQLGDVLDADADELHSEGKTGNTSRKVGGADA